MEQALRRSEKFTQRALDTVEDPFFVKDQKHRWRLLNDAACDMMGKTRAELLGRDDYSIFPPEQVEVFWGHDQEVLDSGRTILKEVLINWGQKAKPRIISTKKSLFLDPSTGEKLIVGTIRDVSRIKAAERENRRLEAQLRQSQKMEAIGTLAGGIAHDFNNILGAIVGFTELAKDKILNKEDAVHELDHVLRAAERARNLVRQILLFSRKASLEMKSVDLNFEVRQAIGLLKRTLPKNIKIIDELMAYPGLVLGDPNQLAQVIMNLASNAADAMTGGGDLFISTRSLEFDSAHGKPPHELESGPHIELCLKDTGCGMEPSLMRKIFDPFFTTKPVGKGTGLGLSTVFGIVKSHAGMITCESVKGKGSVFKVVLPALDHSKWLATDLFSQENKSTYHGYETVLLVDDDPAIRQMVQGMLLRSGYEAMAAATGEEALELFIEEKKKVELVVLDLDMPGMGGVRCLQELNKEKPDVKVLIASGHGGSSLVDRAMALGASSFVDKPFTKEEFLVAVRRVLDRK
jgi:PAS domain S-box-containing protein